MCINIARNRSFRPTSRIWCSVSSFRCINTFVNRDSQTIRLPDNRVLGFAEYGPSSGHPLFFFHGFPSSRLEAQYSSRLAYQRKIRIIAPDRPGFGLSTQQPGRCLVDWPNDVVALAKHLHIDRFTVLGGSGGGPYAIACAHALPAEMLSGPVGVMAGSGPWEAGTEGVPLLARMTAVAAAWSPTALRILTDILVAAARWTTRREMVKSRIENLLVQLAAKEREEGRKGEDEDLTASEQREQILRMLFEAFAQGSSGLVAEAKILSTNWGLRLQDVRTEVKIWHGTKDQQAPIRMLRYMAEKLPNCQLTEFEGVDHFAMAYHLEKILEDLIPVEVTAAEL